MRTARKRRHAIHHGDRSGRQKGTAVITAQRDLIGRAADDIPVGINAIDHEILDAASGAIIIHIRGSGFARGSSRSGSFTRKNDLQLREDPLDKTEVILVGSQQLRVWYKDISVTTVANGGTGDFRPRSESRSNSRPSGGCTPYPAGSNASRKPIRVAPD